MTSDAGSDAGEGDAGEEPSAPSSCDEVDRSAEAAELEGGTSEDQTLSGVYRVDGRVTWSHDNTVTIEPGTVFLMEADSHIVFGFRGDETTVFANGTEEEPILFCGTDDSAGHWQMVELAAGITTNSEFHHVRIEDGGGMDVDAAFDLYHPVLLDSVTVRSSASAGLHARGLDEGSGNLTLTESAYPALLQGPETVTNLPEGDYTGNDEDVIHLQAIHTGSITFHDRGVPYLQLPNRVPFGTDGSVVTFEAGVEYRFSQDAFMVVGFGGATATLFVNGTEDDPVVFTSHRVEDDPQPGDWDGVRLAINLTSDSSIEHARFEYGGKVSDADGGCSGANCGGLAVSGASFSVQDSEFARSAGYGVAILDARGVRINGDTDPIAGIMSGSNTFTDNGEGDAHVYFP